MTTNANESPSKANGLPEDSVGLEKTGIDEQPGTRLTAGSRRSTEQAPVSGLISIVPPETLLNSIPIAVKMKPHGAYELKYLIDEDRARQIMAWARSHLEPDPHARGVEEDHYHVNSLYLDTPDLDVFHRSNVCRQRKYRLRRYGEDSRVWFEVKQKRKGLVRKHRVSVHEQEIRSRVTEPFDPNWDGAWFRQRLDRYQLRPVSQVTYRRFARIGTTSCGTMRLTIDDNLTGCAIDDWQVPSRPLDGIPLLDGQRILELKFQAVMPILFRKLVLQEQLLTTSFSKYRTSVEECAPLDWIVGERSELPGIATS